MEASSPHSPQLPAQGLIHISVQWIFPEHISSGTLWKPHIFPEHKHRTGMTSVARAPAGWYSGRAAWKKWHFSWTLNNSVLIFSRRFIPSHCPHHLQTISQTQMTSNRLSVEMDIKDSARKKKKDSASESSEGSEEHHRENLSLLQEFLNHHEQTVSRSMDTKSTASQKEVRNMLLKISGRGMPLIYWQKDQQNCVLSVRGKLTL